MKETIVISGINLIDGGALSVYYDFLESLIKKIDFNKYKIIALVANLNLFEKFKEKIELIEYPKSKKNWLFRLYYEFVYFKKFSKKINPDYWISLHDVTPNVVAQKRFVYCHNPSPFNKMNFSEIKYGFKYYLFSKFYKYLYAINIQKNTAVIVQQDWIREEFKKIFKLNNVIVARPSIPKVDIIKNNEETVKKIFIYPSYPRYYKNFEVLCEAAKILEKEYKNFEVIITIDGTENKYSKELVEKYSSVKAIRFSGILERSKLYEIYGKANCLIFMSKLETWGMPIIEYKQTNKNMILADLPYAYETVGEYKHVAFVDVSDSQTLAKKMEEIIKNNTIESENKIKKYKEPFAKNWEELIDLIITDKD